jgi:hypothetical protein
MADFVDRLWQAVRSGSLPGAVLTLVLGAGDGRGQARDVDPLVAAGQQLSLAQAEMDVNIETAVMQASAACSTGNLFYKDGCGLCQGAFERAHRALPRGSDPADANVLGRIGEHATADGCPVGVDQAPASRADPADPDSQSDPWAGSERPLGLDPDMVEAAPVPAMVLRVG